LILAPADGLHYVLLFRLPPVKHVYRFWPVTCTPAASIKKLSSDFVFVCSAGIMVARRDACALRDKQFYRKQKFVRCGVCNIRIHCGCLQFSGADLATLTATGESVFNRDACAKLYALTAMIRPRPIHRDLCLMKELWVALHLTQTSFRLPFLQRVLNTRLFDSVDNVPYNWLNP
jgi:hypothetical protein